METQVPLYEGKAKRIFAVPESNGTVVVEYTDQATAFNGEKRGTITNKGSLNNKVSAQFMQLLGQHGVSTHFIELLDENRQLVREVRIVPIEVVVRNIAAGSLCKRTGLEEGSALTQPIVEFYYKRDDLGDPLLNRSHIRMLRLANDETLVRMEDMALQINGILQRYLQDRGILLVDYKLEFGHTFEGELLLADEISPDTCRFWDAETMRKLDKDRFRRDLGDVEEAYAELVDRVGLVNV